jgi:hypothetical protein
VPKNYILRGEWYHYLRRVPKYAKPYDNRQQVRIALKTKCEKEASRLSAVYDGYIEKYWRKLIQTGGRDKKQQGYRRAVDIARAHGFAYKDLSEITHSPIDEVLNRIEASDNKPSQVTEALLGLAERPTIRLEQCIEAYWPLVADRLTGRAEHQIRKFKNQRAAALKNFINVIGNIDLVPAEKGLLGR